MSINKTNYLLLLVVQLAYFSCSQRKDSDVVVARDSMNQGIQKIPNNVNDQDTLSQLKKYFTNNGTSIPLALCSKYIRINDFEQLYSGCYSNELLEYDSLTLFIVTLNCMAGGTCEEMRLLVFDKNRFKSTLRVGLDISDSEF